MDDLSVAPSVLADAFNCPRCQAYAHQKWLCVYAGESGRTTTQLYEMQVSTCAKCGQTSFWYDQRLVIPPVSSAPTASADLPSDLLADYEEAAAILDRSPRGSAALLRLLIQKLCVHLGAPGKDLNADIGDLVNKGLSPKIQQALDIVRVIGNEAVHPGTLDLRDDAATCQQLFSLVNLVVKELITHPAEVEAMYKSLPPGRLEQIQKRDRR